MRIAIMGSGGLGGYFGARLVQGGAADVHFVARGKHLEAMRAGGLRVEGPDPIHAKAVHATDNPAEIGVADVVMLCVKLWDTEQAIEQIRPMVGPGTAIISFQNGVLKDQYLRAAFDARQLMGGVGYVATTIDAPGVIRQTGPMQRLLFGEFDGSRSARGEALLAATPTCHWLEYVDWTDAIAREPVKIENGCWPINDSPGTGLDWDTDAVERYRIA